MAATMDHPLAIKPEEEDVTTNENGDETQPQETTSSPELATASTEEPEFPPKPTLWRRSVGGKSRRHARSFDPTTIPKVDTGGQSKAVPNGATEDKEEENSASEDSAPMLVKKSSNGNFMTSLRSRFSISYGTGNKKRHTVTPSTGGSPSPRTRSSSRPSTREERRKRQENVYNDYLQQSAIEDFSDIQKLDIVYSPGRDFANRPIIVVIAAKLPARTLNMERLLLYFIKVLDPIVIEDYVLVYVHTNMSKQNKPTFSWLKRAYNIFNRKYKKNLKQLYILQPTFFVKTIITCAKPFLSSKFWRKLHYIRELKDFNKFMSLNQLNLPTDIVTAANCSVKKEFEKQIFGVDLEIVCKLYPDTGGIPTPVLHTYEVMLQNELYRVEGIFRVNGNNHRVNELKQKYNRGEVKNLVDEKDAHVIGSLLKVFLRELPEPLFTYDLYDDFIDALDGSNTESTIANILVLLPQMPDPNRAVLRALLALLKQAEECEDNKMNSGNLAICMAPNLFRPRNDTPQIVFQHAAVYNTLLRIMIDHAHDCIGVL